MAPGMALECIRLNWYESVGQFSQWNENKLLCWLEMKIPGCLYIVIGVSQCQAPGSSMPILKNSQHNNISYFSLQLSIIQIKVQKHW